MLIKKCDICNAEIDDNIVVLEMGEKYLSTKITVSDGVIFKNLDVCNKCTNKIIEYCNKHKKEK